MPPPKRTEEGLPSPEQRGADDGNPDLRFAIIVVGACVIVSVLLALTLL